MGYDIPEDHHGPTPAAIREAEFPLRERTLAGVRDEVHALDGTATQDMFSVPRLNVILANTGESTFTKVIEQAGVAGHCVWWGDGTQITVMASNGGRTGEVAAVEGRLRHDLRRRLMDLDVNENAPIVNADFGLLTGIEQGEDVTLLHATVRSLGVPGAWKFWDDPSVNGVRFKRVAKSGAERLEDVLENRHMGVRVLSQPEPQDIPQPTEPVMTGAKAVEDEDELRDAILAEADDEDDIPEPLFDMDNLAGVDFGEIEMRVLGWFFAGHEGVLQHFTYEHLPPYLQEVSKPFCDLAKQIDGVLPQSAEKFFALRKLMEAKDCAVRAAVSADVR